MTIPKFYKNWIESLSRSEARRLWEYLDYCTHNHIYLSEAKKLAFKTWVTKKQNAKTLKPSNNSI